VKLKIKKGATVEVIAGAEKGKKGNVIEINTKDMKIKVQGVRIQTKNDRKEGFIKREGYIDYSNVKMVEQAPKKKSKVTKA
jgi:large subunit ribosomal protein L24